MHNQFMNSILKTVYFVLNPQKTDMKQQIQYSKFLTTQKNREVKITSVKTVHSYDGWYFS